MERTNDTPIHIRHTQIDKHWIYHHVLKCSATIFLLTKFFAFIFLSLYLTSLLYDVFDPQYTFHMTVPIFIDMARSVFFLTIPVVLLGLLLLQIVIPVKRRLASADAVDFLFYPDSLVIIAKNGAESKFLYEDVEYIQEKEGYDFFYLPTKTTHKMIAIPKEKIRENDTYQNIVEILKKNGPRKRNFMRRLVLMIWGFKNGKS